jgi:hypothetical protein
LAEEAVPYVVGQAYQLDVIADGNTLEVRVDGAPLFGGPITDNTFATGSLALYSWGNAGTMFDDVVVTATTPLLLAENFNDGTFVGWTMVDEGSTSAPSGWSASTGSLIQSSNIYDGDLSAGGLPKNGTFAWYTNGLGWSNYHLALQVQSAGSWRKRPCPMSSAKRINST